MTEEEKKFSFPLTNRERDLQRSVMALREENDMLEESSDYWHEQFVRLFNEVNEHKVLSSVLENYAGESDEQDKINW